MLGQVRAMELTDTDPMLLDSVIVSDSPFGLTHSWESCPSPKLFQGEGLERMGDMLAVWKRSRPQIKNFAHRLLTPFPWKSFYDGQDSQLCQSK